MIRQCARCLIIIGEKPPYSDKRISHGECDKCFEEKMKKLEKYGQEKVRKVA